MYFKLILENGHVGAGRALETVRYFRADSMVDVFGLAARLPRVKGKERGAGVKLVQPVSREEYLKGIREMSTDGYLATRKKKGSRRKKEAVFH